MKKIYFAIAACAMFAFTACNNSTEAGKSDSAADTAKKTEEPAPAPAADTTKKMDDTAKKADAPKADAKAEKK